MADATTIEISKEYLHFAAAHFTIFSATERENLHGHNFQVTLDVDADVGADGLAFDYNILKSTLKNICDDMDECVLMPEHSPHLTFETDDTYTYAIFADERIPFLARDLKILPVRNVTVEELSSYLLQRLSEHEDVSKLAINRLHLRCSSGEGQWAGAIWTASQPSP